MNVQEMSIEQLINQYELSPAELKTSLVGLSSEQLLATPFPGKWSIQQIVCHLADAEAGALQRIRRIVAEDHPTIGLWDQDAFATKLYYESTPIQLALDAFAALRAFNVHLLRRLPEESYLTRSGVHPVRGEWTLRRAFEVYSEHGVKHLEQIERIKTTF